MKPPRDRKPWLERKPPRVETAGVPRPHDNRAAGRHREGGAPLEAIPGALRIWGLHAVEAALANERRRFARIALTESAEKRLAPHAAARGLTVVRALPRDLDRLLGAEAVHQGALAEVEPLPEASLDALIEAAKAGAPLLVLDQVTDPHNVGAILRSAAVFGAAGVVMTRHHSPPLEGALAKAASGALELVPVAHVPNLARALAEMEEAFVSRIGLDGEGTHLLEDETFEAPAAIVVGAEGRGLRRLTREHCDRLVRIGAAGSLASLNVSNATAVALYAASRTRTRA
ncbi:MAG: 23S rRNA (guanosine(2251)-2'-O)-methyltransferase RlmB [Hyphomicrobiaceae bacterium]